MVDVLSSGSGQMPSNPNSTYQRFEQSYGLPNEVTQINEDDYDDDEETYQPFNLNEM